MANKSDKYVKKTMKDVNSKSKSRQHSIPPGSQESYNDSEESKEGNKECWQSYKCLGSRCSGCAHCNHDYSCSQSSEVVSESEDVSIDAREIGQQPQINQVGAAIEG
jgi:hypothetical protein